MPQKIICTLWFTYFVLLSSAQTNRALLVAIDSYPSGSGWVKIHAVNDTSIVMPMLIEQGYRRDHIQVLINDKATKQTIVQELKNIRKQSGPGDYIYIHFSCHGQQMIDDNNDEPDGLDEALIPYDAKRWYKKGIYEGENHLRDDEVEMLLNHIRRKIGSHGCVTVVFDACHSGTADRETDDDIYIRGTTFIFGPENSKPIDKSYYKTIHPLQKGKELSPIRIFSACQPDQVNYEYKSASDVYYGSLSYAFCEVVKKAKSGMRTSELFDQLEIQMQTMFSNKRQKQTPYFESTHNNEKFRMAQ